ncbi:RNA polymerase sigma factor [Kangiella sp. HZ709]|uniref:RNA polymerase sigma factor n=1 Tax=Kangiella sp. HZ709 TaxID=2666328 RepID=UPI0012B15CE7|nr:DUF6596 domain-containing protein [Kangiella sp. HZ709]MRX27852.1 RNA polymerase subunit sigma-24 [Kangiella sp. HZ709]
MQNNKGTDSVDIQVERAVRSCYGKLLSQLTYHFRSLDLAEEAIQEATISAFVKWKKLGIPNNPESWLFIASKRKAIDIIRKNKSHAQKKQNLIIYNKTIEPEVIELSDQDRRLELIFTCCHPALDTASQVALTLNTVCGFSVDEIAKAFLLKKTTMAQRLVRTKQKISKTNIPYQIPEPHQLEQRLSGVLGVIYLIFNEAYYSKGSKYLSSKPLAEEAIRLAKLVNKQLPHRSELLGLLALMAFNFVRFNAKIDKFGRSINLKMQNRQLWQHEWVERGNHYLESALTLKKLGPYQIQAAISAVHSTSKSFAETDWQQIHALYQKLLQYQTSPIIELNAAIALAYSNKIEHSLKLIQKLEQEGQLSQYHLLYMAKAYCLKELSRNEQSKEAINRAIELSDNQFQKDYFQKELESWFD